MSFCSRPFEAELLSKEELDSSEATKVGDFSLGGSIVGGPTRGGLQMSRGSLILGLSDEEKNAVAMRPEEFTTYKLTYRCKHCAKEWSKLDVEEIPLPREYVEDEQED